jgi:hypothetical protein
MKNKLCKWILPYFDIHYRIYKLNLIIVLKYDVMRSSVQFLFSIWRHLTSPFTARNSSRKTERISTKFDIGEF